MIICGICRKEFEGGHSYQVLVGDTFEPVCPKCSRPYHFEPQNWDHEHYQLYAISC